MSSSIDESAAETGVKSPRNKERQNFIRYDVYKWLKSHAMINQSLKVDELVERQLKDMFSHLGRSYHM